MTNIDYSRRDAPEFVPSHEISSQNFIEALNHDPIAHVRSLVRVVSPLELNSDGCHILIFNKCRASSLRRQYFAEVVTTLKQANLQLLRDVDTRWSSTLLMFERALMLREVCIGLSLFN